MRHARAQTIALIAAACAALAAASPAALAASGGARHRAQGSRHHSTRIHHAATRHRHRLLHTRRHRHSRSLCSHASRAAHTALSHACVASLRNASPGSAAKRHHRAPARPSASSQRAAQRAAAIARALAAACENTQITPEPANLEVARAAVLCLINHERATNGELPLTVDSRLQFAAEDHARELVSANYFAHVSPSGVTPVDRIRATGYIPGPEFGYIIGENLAWGTLSLSTPQAIVEAWMASPDHRANILESRYVETGIGIAPAVPASLSGGSPGGTYAQEFGTIVS